MGAEEKQMMQWHPAFFAGLQIELQEEAEHLIFENGLYQSLMNMIVRANQKTFQEVRVMCEVLEELMKDEIDAKVEMALQRGIERGRIRGIEAFILDNLEEQIPKERILAKLEKRFELDTQQAAEYYDRYSKLQNQQSQ